MPTRRFIIATIVVTVGSLVGAAGCGGQERSASAYCKTYKDGFEKIKKQYPDVDQYTHNRGENPLAMLLSATAAYGDIVALMGDMAKSAPDGVQTDVQRVHDTLQKQLDTVGDAATNPWGTIASQLVAGITTSGAMSRMSTYTRENCGGVLFGASAQQ